MVLSVGSSKHQKAGLAYVALSRVTSLDGLFLAKFDEKSILLMPMCLWK